MRDLSVREEESAGDGLRHGWESCWEDVDGCSGDAGMSGEGSGVYCARTGVQRGGLAPGGVFDIAG